MEMMTVPVWPAFFPLTTLTLRFILCEVLVFATLSQKSSDTAFTTSFG